MSGLGLKRLICAVGLAGVTFLVPVTASAAPCGNDGSGFSSWVRDFKREARRSGISQRAIDGGLDGAKYNRRVIRLDRSQRSFKLSFKKFYARRVSGSLLSKGRRLMRSHAKLFSRIEKRYGVPPQIIVAIWGLESNYGRGGGKMPIIESLATLAYDCRRSSFFKKELVAALRIVSRGDMAVSQLRGGWAGEIGPMQFLASSYLKYAVDFDGNGRRDLIRSTPDMLGSTGNYLRAYGWQRGQGWAPGSANYSALKGWNKASVYVRTIAAMAEKLR
ncbi:MAG TPA: lytic murein transglycosylase [Hyphomicrobiaceae bacterium]|nr:lytic murein transglycosylase [Hyphomicrobiaceae bacterium]